MTVMRLTLLGATGSIGASAVDVMLQHPKRFAAHALVGYRNAERMREIALQLTPDRVVMTDAAAAAELREQLPSAIRVDAGMEAAVEVAGEAGVDMVLAAMVGSVGLPAALAAVRAGKRVGLANKECLVTAGHIFMDAAKRSGAVVVPVDSEHAAVHQCLAGHDAGSVTRIILTASGGPFRDRDPASLHDVTPEEAIAHPNWDMGAKISVDSATMMNKALELIEARWLFDMPAEKLSAIIHPQSIVHALVEYCDGSVLAQLAWPDMRAPIAYAMQAEPRLATGIPRLELATSDRLDFQAVDESRFPAMRLVRDVMHGGDSLATAMNAANEVANQAFRERRIAFTDIVPLVERVLEGTPGHSVTELDQVWSVDAEARRMAEAAVRSAA
jgi:1-deoxy-D-xylulose-5-phosphate reductoisomerase